MDFQVAFDTIANAFQENLRCVKQSRRLPSSEINHFCTTVAFVALGIRTAFLVDALATIRDKQYIFEGFVNVLLERNVKNVRLLREPSFEQFLFVNVDLLNARLIEEEYLEKWPTFVLLNDVPSITSLPKDVSQQLSYIAEQSPLPVITLPDTLTPVQLVPLIGFLLDYPVAFVPTSAEQTSFLSGVPLDVYDCTIVRAGEDSNTLSVVGSLIKFSCPVDLADSAPWLEPSKMAERLSERFKERLNGIDENYDVAVTHETRTFDRVAL